MHMYQNVMDNVCLKHRGFGGLWVGGFLGLVFCFVFLGFFVLGFFLDALRFC